MCTPTLTLALALTHCSITPRVSHLFTVSLVHPSLPLPLSPGRPRATCVAYIASAPLVSCLLSPVSVSVPASVSVSTAVIHLIYHIRAPRASLQHPRRRARHPYAHAGGLTPEIRSARCERPLSARRPSPIIHKFIATARPARRPLRAPRRPCVRMRFRAHGIDSGRLIYAVSP